MKNPERERDWSVLMHDEEPLLPITDTLNTDGDRKKTAVHESLWGKVRYWFQVNSFSPGFLRPPWSHPLLGYLVGGVLQVLAVALMIVLVQMYPSFHFPGALMLLVVLVVSLFWGAGPGLTTLIGGTLLFVFLLLPPYYSLQFARVEDLAGVLIFLAVGVTISVVASQVERARAEAVMQRREVEHLYAQLAVEQRTLRASELETRARISELEAIFEGVTDGIALFDTRGIVLQMNAALREILSQYFSHDILTSTVFTREGLQHLSPKNEQGEPVTIATSPVMRILRGEVLTGMDAPIISLAALNHQERLLVVGGAPISDKEGHITGAVVVVRDVTERRQADKRTQEALEALLVMAEELVSFPVASTKGADEGLPTPNAVAQRLAELIRSVLACQRVSITTFDPESHALRSTAVVGLAPELEKLWRERRPGFLLSEQVGSPMLDARFQNDEVILMDLSRPPYNSRPNPFGIQTMLLAPMNVGRRLIGVLVLDHGGDDRVYTPNDIALTKAVAKLAALVVERERLLADRADAQARELALREANALMDEFIAIAGHEIRTPLTTIKGSVQLAKRQLGKVMKRDAALPIEAKSLILSVQDLIDRAERQIGMQNRLVSDLLDVARIRSNRLELHPELCDLVLLVRETVQDEQYLAESRTIHCTIEAQGELLVMADADRIRQVISNYLSNALKYSKAEQPVSVRLSHNRDLVRMEVRDHGPGLPLVEQERIWERFYRVEGIETRSGSGVGLGLGLHICRMIIERQGGHVGVDSIPGQGATFWFTLPLAETLDTAG